MDYDPLFYHQINVSGRTSRQPEISHWLRMIIDVGIVSCLPDENRRLDLERAEFPGSLLSGLTELPRFPGLSRKIVAQE